MFGKGKPAASSQSYVCLLKVAIPSNLINDHLVTRFAFLIPLILTMAIACGGGSDSPPVQAGNGATAVLTPGAVEGTGTAVTVDPDRIPPPAGSSTPSGDGRRSIDDLSIDLDRVFPALTFKWVTGLYPLPDGRWLALQQGGIVALVDSSGASSSVFLDIEDRVQSNDFEIGLLGLAIADDFAESGVFYLFYTTPDPLRSILSRFDSQGDVGDPESETILLEIAQPSKVHQAGQIVFGPDEYLYVAVGDGGGARDPMGHGQNLNSLYGSLLRIDVLGEEPYRVPADNPFVGQAGARGEIWAYGLRNPWRFSFDSLTDQLWLTDAGASTREEVDIISKGENYGWSIMEGIDCYRADSCSREGLQPPIFDYVHDGGNCAVIGGFVYRGSDIASLQGAYIYGDYCSGRVWALRVDGGEVVENAQVAAADFRISSFGQGHDGEIYVLEHTGDGGGVYKLVPGE